jgi:hypothetical protein
MDLKVYRDELTKLTRDYDNKLSILQRDYAFSNSSVKIGDIVADHIGSVKVAKILYTIVHNGDYPTCVYRGVEFTKAGKPRKDKSIRDVYQTNLKEA